MGGMGGADMGGFNNPFDLFEQFFGASGGRGAGVRNLPGRPLLWLASLLII